MTQLKYCNQVWSSLKMGDKTALENVQRRVTKMVPGLEDLSYEQQLRVGIDNSCS